MTYRLAEHPDHITPLAHCNLEPGATVKLLFDHYRADEHVTAEAMWVEVEQAEAGRYVGALRNTSAVDEHVQWGDRLHFEARHIVTVQQP